MSSEETIIISGYKQKVKYYGFGPFPAWVLMALPVVTFFLGKWL